MRSLERDLATILAVLRRPINARESFVYHLPPELLSLAASYLPKTDLVKATHVSHRWRTILVSFPRLWSDICLPLGEGAITFLERSGSTPINVSMNIPHHDSGYATAANFLKQHATRIETLTIASLDHVPMLLPPMPSLRKLDLFWDRIRGLCTETNDATDELAFPTVTTLTVRGGRAFPFSVSQLTRLQVHSPIVFETTKLLDFLNTCPGLEELEVDYYRQLFTNDGGVDVDLPHLRFYSHSTSTNSHLRLFDKLSFPPSCSVVFNYRNGPRNPHLIHGVIPFYNPSPLADIKRISLNADDGGATIELIDAEDIRVYLVVDVGMNWEDPSIEEDINKSYATYLESINIHTVEVLCVQAKALWMPYHPEGVLSRLENIRTLVVSELVSLSYILPLGTESNDRTHADGDNDTDGWLCPTLDTLVIFSREFRDVETPVILEYLLATAIRRKDSGIPFKTVSLFIRNPWDERQPIPMRSCLTLEQMRGCVDELEVVTGDDAFDWSMDDYFFDGLDLRRDRHIFSRKGGQT